MAGDEELTTTLRVKVDRTEYDAWVKDVEVREQRGTRVGGMQAPGSTGGTTSTAAPRPGRALPGGTDLGAMFGIDLDPGANTSSTSGTSGGGRGQPGNAPMNWPSGTSAWGTPPPGSNTSSTAGGPGGGGGGSGGGSGGGGGSRGGGGNAWGVAVPGQRVGPRPGWDNYASNNEVDFNKRASSFKGTNYDDYMVSTGTSSTARMLAGGLFAGRPAGALLNWGATAIGDSLVAGGRREADTISRMREFGVPEAQIPAMSMMGKYAGPIGAVVSAAASSIVNTVSEGQDLQKSYSQRIGRAGRDMAFSRFSGIGFSTGPDGKSGWESAAGIAASSAEYGMSFEEGVGARRAYANSTGYVDPSVSYAKAQRISAQTGTSMGAIGAFVANGRFGQPYADPTQSIASANAAGLRGEAVDGYLRDIAAHTRQMAFKGVQVDLEDFQSVMDRGVQAGFQPEVMASGARNLMGANLSMRDQLLQPFQAYGNALLMQQALTGAGTLEDVIGNLSNQGGSASSSLDAMRRAGSGSTGRLTMAAMTGTGLGNDFRYLGDGTGVGLADMTSGPGAEPSEWARIEQRLDARRFGVTQNQSTYAAQAAYEGNKDELKMAAGKMANKAFANAGVGTQDVPGAIEGAMLKAQQSSAKALEVLVANQQVNDQLRAKELAEQKRFNDAILLWLSSGRQGPQPMRKGDAPE